MDDVEFRELMRENAEHMKARAEAADARAKALESEMTEMRRRFSAERATEDARREVEKRTADYLRAEGKLHMRGLLEYAEGELLQDGDLKDKIQQAEASVDHGLISKGLNESYEKISRRGRWTMALEMERYNSLFSAIKDKHDRIETTESAGAAIAKLHGMLNSNIHRALTDDVLDPSNPAGTHVIVIAMSVGIPEAHILECIANHFFIPCVVY